MSHKNNDILYDMLKDQQAEDFSHDYRLREEAGLVDSGLDEEGNILWIGTDAQWRRYEQLLLEKIKKPKI